MGYLVAAYALGTVVVGGYGLSLLMTWRRLRRQGGRLPEWRATPAVELSGVIPADVDSSALGGTRDTS